MNYTAASTYEELVALMMAAASCTRAEAEATLVEQYGFWIVEEMPIELFRERLRKHGLSEIRISDVKELFNEQEDADAFLAFLEGATR